MTHLTSNTWCSLGLAFVVAACGSSSDDTPAGADEQPQPGSGGSIRVDGGSGGKGGTGGSTGKGGDTGSGGSTGTGGSVGTGGSTGKGGNTGSGGGPKSDGGPGCAAAFAPTGTPPTLTPGTWTDITPPGMTKGDPGSIIGTGLANDPCNPAVLYWCNEPFTPSNGGLFKSVDAGATWRRVAAAEPMYMFTDHLDEPIAVVIDPTDPQHLYVADGVRGSSGGFWVSTDGGERFVQPQGYVDAFTAEGLTSWNDAYDVALDPTDSNHVLVTYHSPWGGSAGGDAGVAESKDGGSTWTLHLPTAGWGYGHAVNFLYDPARGVGDSQTWLLGTQGNGQWRTTDGGATWTKVTDHSIMHGGGTIYYAKTGTLYATSVDTILRSTDNGASWTPVGPSQANNGYTGILGDGNRMYTTKVYGPVPFRTSLESDGATWTDYNAQTFGQGPFQLAFDRINGIMYASMWNYGVWALKVN